VSAWGSEDDCFGLRISVCGSVLGAITCFPRDPFDPQLSLSPTVGWPNRVSESESRGYAQSICDGSKVVGTRTCRGSSSHTTIGIKRA
jgi:hypothetical protein